MGLFHSFGTPEQQEHRQREVTENRLLLAGIGNIGDDSVEATDRGAHLLLNGGKHLNTRLPVTDRLVVGVATVGTFDESLVLADVKQSGII